MKKSVMIVLVLAMVLALAGCGNEGSKTPAATATPAPDQSSAPTGGNETTTDPVEFDGKLYGPFVMTTCGQSTGSVMFHMIAVQAGLQSADEHQLKAADLANVGKDAKTLVITTGTSGKGMGAAGTDINDEISRCSEVAKAAKEAGMTIVCAHIEGMSRRTDANDQASIDAILPLADVIVCVEESNSDNLFSNYAAEHNIPIIIVPDSLSLGEYLA